MRFSCAGGTKDIKVTLGGSATFASSTTADVDVGLELGPLKIGGGLSQSQGSSQTISNSTQFSVPPGMQAVMTTGVVHKVQKGKVQAHYGSRVAGHFIVSNEKKSRIILILTLD